MAGLNLANLTVEELLTFANHPGFSDELIRRVKERELWTPEEVYNLQDELELSYDSYAETRYVQGKEDILEGISKCVPDRKEFSCNLDYFSKSRELHQHIDKLLNHYKS